MLRDLLGDQVISRRLFFVRNGFDRRTFGCIRMRFDVGLIGIEMAEDRFYGKQQVQCRVAGNTADGGGKMPAARGNGTLNEMVGAAARGLYQGSARFRADRQRFEFFGGGDHCAVTVENGHVGVRIVQPRNHRRGGFRRALPVAGNRRAEQDGGLARTQGDTFDGGGQGRAAEAAADTHEKRAPFAGRADLPAGGEKLAKGDIGAIRAGIQKVVDVVMAEKRGAAAVRPEHAFEILRKQHDGFTPRKRQAHPFMDGDVDKRILFCGHVQA